MSRVTNIDEFVVFLPNLVSLKTVYLKFEDNYIKFSSRHTMRVGDTRSL